MLTYLYFDIVHKTSDGEYEYDISLYKNLYISFQLRVGDNVSILEKPFQELDLDYSEEDINPKFKSEMCPDFESINAVNHARVAVDDNINHVYLESQDIYFEYEEDLKFFINYLINNDGWELGENNNIQLD